METRDKENILEDIFNVTNSLDEEDKRFILAIIQGYALKSNFDKITYFKKG